MRIAYVDLSRGEARVDDAPHLIPRYLGGVGVNAKLLFDFLPPGADPLGPDNPLIFGAGLLVGTNLPTASRTEVTAKSPLTGLLGTSNSGLTFGASLKYAGIDHLVVLGKAPHPVYLLVSPEGIELKDASWLWGRDNAETLRLIRQREGRTAEVASIGPAGENLVRYASIQNDLHHSWGRTGLGAVMGAKGLKAVVVKGSRPLKVADLKGTLSLAREATERVLRDDSFGYTRRYGTVVASDPYNRMGALPGYNFRRGRIEGWEETRGRRAVAKYKVKALSCLACPIACRALSRLQEDHYFHGPEITYLLEFGAKLAIQRVEDIALAVRDCNLLGLDVISTCGAIAFLIEAKERGIVQGEGIPTWGDAEGIRGLIQDIALRRGWGDVLAEGVKRAAARIPASEPYALHVKGLELPVRDPRAKWDTWTLGYLTNVRGGDHLRTRSPAEHLLGGTLGPLEEELGVSEEFVRGMDMPEGLKVAIFGEPPQRVSIPLMAKYAEELITLINAMGVCIRPPVLRTFGPELFGRMLDAVVGLRIRPEEVLLAAERIWNLQHLFNLREGLRIEEFRLPDRFLREDNGNPPLEEGAVKEALHRYFQARGWREDAVPLEEKIASLGLWEEASFL